MILAAWLHNLGPFAFKITQDFGLRWYGLSYAMGFVAGWMLLRFLCKRGACLIPLDRIGDAVLLAVMGVVVGGRLGYVIFYEPSLITHFDKSSPPWWGVLMINHGGMASHGGMIGVIISAFFIGRGFKTPTGTRIGKAPTLHILDTLAMIACAGLGLGRLANFINGELLGKIVALPGQPAPWWAVRFPQELQSTFMKPDGTGGHRPELTPEQFKALDAVMEPFRIPGRSIDEAFGRVIEKIQSGDHALARAIEPFISARHPSQLYQAFTDGVIVFAFTWFIARKPRLPGIVGCWFLISYGILRIITEFYRLPDAQLANQRIMGFSRGQWLSAAMVAVGFIALPIIIRRGGKKLGGWWSITAAP